MVRDKNKSDDLGEDQDFGLTEDITDEGIGEKGGVSDSDELIEDEKTDEKTR